jgi:predicted nucleic acid-binding protein
MAALIFIDTNIYLDFYRYRGGSDTSFSILKHFDENHDRIIITSEIEMEYKKIVRK